MGPAKTVLVLGVFAAAVRMLIAMYNGFVAANSPSNFVSSQVEPVLAPSAFLLAVFSLLGWTAVYGRILGRLAQARAGRSPPARAARWRAPFARVPSRLARVKRRKRRREA